jgi:undecaprenyl diphosphate synthase
LAVLNHVALILDGNRRWAHERGLPTIEGYKRGADRVKEVLSFATQRAIPILTMYFFSTENWGRNLHEVKGLFAFMDTFLKENLSLLIEEGVKLSMMGRLDRLPPFLKSSVENAIHQTSGCKKIRLNLALDYGGRDEILRAVSKVALHHKGDLNLLSEEHFSRYLDSPGMPDPDFVIRTGGEMRISNFLLWQIAYAELYFTNVLWPDFSCDDFEEALTNFEQRSRRRGGDARSISRLV